MENNKETFDIYTHISILDRDIRLIITEEHIYVLQSIYDLTDIINILYELDKKNIDTKRAIFQLFCSILNGEKFSKLNFYDLLSTSNYLDEQEEAILKDYIVTIDDNKLIKIKYRRNVYQAISDIIYTLSTLIYLIDFSFSRE